MSDRDMRRRKVSKARHHRKSTAPREQRAKTALLTPASGGGPTGDAETTPPPTKWRYVGPELPAEGALQNFLGFWQAAVLDNEDDSTWLDWFGESRAEWEGRNQHLAQRAASGSDDALFELISRDPRYLGTELVIAKVLEAADRALKPRNGAQGDVAPGRLGVGPR